MRKLIVWINTTANDIVSGPPTDKNSLIWSDPANIEDFSARLSESMVSVDAILLGRATYEILTTQWPHVAEWPDVSDIVLRLGEQINTTPKVVVSGHPIEGLHWGTFEPPTQLTGPNAQQQIRQLKASEGGDIIIFGSLTLVQSLTKAGLVDEYAKTIYPVVMNEGKRLFENLDARMDLQLISAESSEHGGILVKYAPDSPRAARRDPME